MAIESAWCTVLQAMVTRVTTLEGDAITVICSEFDPASKVCHAKSGVRRNGPLAQLLERVSENTLADRGSHCNLA
jgi:hypothetical protein